MYGSGGAASGFFYMIRFTKRGYYNIDLLSIDTKHYEPTTSEYHELSECYVLGEKVDVDTAMEISEELIKADRVEWYPLTENEFLSQCQILMQP